MRLKLLMCAFVTFSILCSTLAEEEEDAKPAEESAPPAASADNTRSLALIKGKHCMRKNPFYASLRKPIQNQFCAGTVITPNWLMTACRCIINTAGQILYSVVDLANYILGESPMNDGSSAYPPNYPPGFGPGFPAVYPGGSPYPMVDGTGPYGVDKRELQNLPKDDLWCHWAQIIKIHGHPSFDKRSGQNDIALLRMDSPLKKGRFLRLPPKPFAGDLLRSAPACGGDRKMVSWFGDESGKRVAHTHVDDCKRAYRSRKFGKSLMCTQTLGENSCNYENGAPLVCGNTAYAIVSLGSECNGSTPGVFTRVDQHLQFIRGVMTPRSASGSVKILVSEAVLIVSLLFRHLSI
ncbi:unnamed protein product [Phaedon cochleariae]|uniref:Peptidase S1 domain-containing protein n=1 Tax=Phaedon cochleariae TaxID=80249 RepID=A0A9N9SCV1_PHACE|nr:unnamed protein product [Phaedon cochleariae]